MFGHLDKVHKAISEAVYRQITLRHGSMPTEEESIKLCRIKVAHDHSTVEMEWEGQTIMRAFPNNMGPSSCLIIEISSDEDHGLKSKWQS